MLLAEMDPTIVGRFNWLRDEGVSALTKSGQIQSFAIRRYMYPHLNAGSRLLSQLANNLFAIWAPFLWI